MSECDSFCFCRGKLVEAGRQCVVVEVDEVSWGWVFREGGVSYGVGYRLHMEREMGQRDLRLRKVIVRCGLGGGNVDVHDDSQMVRDGEVGVCESFSIWRPVEQTSSRMSTAVGGEIYMLSKVETAENVQKVCCAFAVRGVDMNV